MIRFRVSPAIAMFALALALVLVLGTDRAAADIASANWFTVHGDPTAPDQDVVQVDPVARDTEPRVMAVRVNRNGPRTSWDGVPYRSYVAEVEFDCPAQTALYRRITFYGVPLWRASAVRTVDYTTGPPRAMKFRDVQPNPSQRIVNAACGARR